MPPKAKDEKNQKRKDDGTPDAAQAELLAMQGAKQDLELGQAVLIDKLQQCQAENEQVVQHMAQLKARITNSTQDYIDILQHRGEQIKAAEARASSLQQQLEHLQQELAQAAKEVSALKESNAAQAARLDDAAAMLDDKDRLEETVKKQHALIEQRGQELKLVKAQLDGKEAALQKAKGEAEDLKLKCQASTQLPILFGEPWLVQITHARLAGAVPHDREYNTLSCTAGGKQLVLHGGHSRMHESAGRETALLSLDSLTWELPETAMQANSLLGHSSSVVGRNKLLVFGGSTGEEATAAVQQLATDSMRWTTINTSSASTPQPRLAHAAVALSDKIYIIGGMTIEGQLLDDVWTLELDSWQWTQLQTFGAAPCARKGASLCATEDGRRLYLFGGHDGNGPLNDCHYLEVEQLLWNSTEPAGTPPEPREGHMAAVLGRYLLVSGGCGQTAVPPSGPLAGGAAAAAAGSGVLLGQQPSVVESLQGTAAGPAGAASIAGAAAAAGAPGSAGTTLVGKRLTDTFVLDMDSGPCWEQLDDGSSINAMWLKQMASCSAMHGNKLYTLQPNLSEQLVELRVMSLTLPDEIERLKAAKRRDKEQVNKLELLECVGASSSSIDVSWRPPTKNKERISGYKLMLSTSTGVVREVYQGKAASFTCTGLKPAAEYVLSVKATYDDGSTLWSDSEACHTNML